MWFPHCVAFDVLLVASVFCNADVDSSRSCAQLAPALSITDDEESHRSPILPRVLLQRNTRLKAATSSSRSLDLIFSSEWGSENASSNNAVNTTDLQSAEVGRSAVPVPASVDQASRTNGTVSNGIEKMWTLRPTEGSILQALLFLIVVIISLLLMWHCCPVQPVETTKDAARETSSDQPGKPVEITRDSSRQTSRVQQGRSRKASPRGKHAQGTSARKASPRAGHPWTSQADDSDGSVDATRGCCQQLGGGLPRTQSEWRSR